MCGLSVESLTNSLARMPGASSPFLWTAFERGLRLLPLSCEVVTTVLDETEPRVRLRHQTRCHIEPPITTPCEARRMRPVNSTFIESL